VILVLPEAAFRRTRKVAAQDQRGRHNGKSQKANLAQPASVFQVEGDF
jgi:hypothetical protein